MNAGSRAAEATGSQPNLLLIVMDCVRSPEFSSGSPLVAAMPFASGMASESIEFSRAVSPASWTIPAHASLFSGRYPWDHRLHARGVPKLPADVPSLARSLGRAGYRTASFSSNPFVSDTYGLTDGFQHAVWGGWWERYARHLGIDRPPAGREPGTDAPAGFRRLRNSRAWPATLSASRWSLRYPLLLHTANRALRAIRGRPGECPACVSPWIERSLADWMSQQPAEAPVFVFVNLMEAHEPYMILEGAPSWSARWEALTLRQDFSDWLEGRWTPSPHELEGLRALYGQAIKAIDHRLRGIVGAFQTSGRWSSTATVLTSDHGQALGEEGALSHGMSVGDSITRIPLWLRLPNREFGGTSSNSWSSLVDVAPTFASLAGIPEKGGGDGINLLEIRSAPRASPVWSMAEGVIWPEARARLHPARLRAFDKVSVAGYLGETKVTTDGTGGISVVRARLSDGDGTSVPEERPELMVEGMRAYLHRLESTMSEPPDPKRRPDPDRLASWGYV